MFLIADEAADALDDDVGGQQKERHGHQAQDAAFLAFIGFTVAQSGGQPQAHQHGGSGLDTGVNAEAGTVLLQRRITHDVAGLAELDQILTAQPGGLRIAIERAEGLLVEHLHALHLAVYCVSPKISARARERYRLAASKSDTFDAYVLADTLRHEHAHWRPLSPPSPLLAELRAITRDRQRIRYAQQACESRLRAVMDAYHPAPLHLFSMPSVTTELVQIISQEPETLLHPGACLSLHAWAVAPELIDDQRRDEKLHHMPRRENAQRDNRLLAVSAPGEVEPD